MIFPGALVETGQFDGDAPSLSLGVFPWKGAAIKNYETSRGFSRPGSAGEAKQFMAMKDAPRKKLLVHVEAAKTKALTGLQGLAPLPLSPKIEL